MYYCRSTAVALFHVHTAQHNHWQTPRSEWCLVNLLQGSVSLSIFLSDEYICPSAYTIFTAISPGNYAMCSTLLTKQYWLIANFAPNSASNVSEWMSQYVWYKATHFAQYELNDGISCDIKSPWNAQPKKKTKLTKTNKTTRITSRIRHTHMHNIHTIYANNKRITTNYTTTK